MPRIITSTTQFDPMPTMASCDSASTSLSVSPPQVVERHRLRRKRSPSPSSHSQHFSVNPFAAHRPYSPSTRASDIARLLDPTYASPSHQTAFKPLGPRTAIREVYVDHHGDLHDPDFRDFPTFGHSKPRWERAYTDESDDEEEDEETLKRRVSIEKQWRRPSTTPYYTAPAYYPYDEPSSYESRHLAEVDDEDDQLDHHECAPLKEKCFTTRCKSPEKRPHTEKDTYPQNPHVEEPEPIVADSDWTPTCGHVVRRQWHAFTLSLRFSLFRTKRRIQRRMFG